MVRYGISGLMAEPTPKGCGPTVQRTRSLDGHTPPLTPVKDDDKISDNSVDSISTYNPTNNSAPLSLMKTPSCAPRASGTATIGTVCASSRRLPSGKRCPVAPMVKDILSELISVDQRRSMGRHEWCGVLPRP